MHTVEIPEIHFKASFPSEIDELTNEQFVYFSSLCLKLFQKQITIPELKTAMVLRLLNVDSRGFSGLPKSIQVRISENIFQIASLLTFLFVESESDFTYNLNFTKNFVPAISIRPWLSLSGPEAALTNLTFLQYKDANTFYRSFHDTQHENDLNQLISILYVPVWFGYSRSYSPKRSAKFLNIIASLPFEIRFAIFIFYSACERFLRDGSINIDGHTVNLSILYSETLSEKKLSKPQKFDTNIGLASVALSLASTGIYGPIERVYSQNLYDVLFLLYKQRIEYLNSIEND